MLIETLQFACVINLNQEININKMSILQTYFICKFTLSFARIICENEKHFKLHFMHLV